MIYAMSSNGGWSVNGFLDNMNNTSTSSLVTGSLIISLIGVLIAVLVFAIFAVWVVELILMCVHKSKVRVAKQHMDELNDKLRKLKRREDVNKYDIADAQDDVDTAYKQYQAVLDRRYKHKRRFVIFLVIWIVLFIGRIAIVVATGYQTAKVIDEYYQENSQGGAKTLNDLGAGTYWDSGASYAEDSFNSFMQE